MPQVIVFAAIGAAAIAGWKLVKREMARAEAQLRAAEFGERQVLVPVRTLVRGPDGVYRPSDRS
jgi:hypothetical protein